VFITASFYSYIAARRADVGVNSAAFRKLVSPLNPPRVPGLSSLVQDASTTSFHLAMLVGAALLVIGAVVNAVGIRNPETAAAVSASSPSSPVTPPAPAKEPA
jgi:hypothetical protein